MKRYLKRVCAMGMAVTMLLTVLSVTLAFNESLNGNFIITLENTSGTAQSNVTLGLYRIGDITSGTGASDAVYTLDAALAATQVDLQAYFTSMDNADKKTATATIAAYIEDQGIAPYAQAVTGTDGKASFSGVALGAYILILDATGGNSITMTSVILSVPYLNADDSVWYYTIYVAPKVSTDSGGSTDTPDSGSSTDTPGTGSSTDKPGSGGSTDKPTGGSAASASPSTSGGGDSGNTDASESETLIDVPRETVPLGGGSFAPDSDSSATEAVPSDTIVYDEDGVISVIPNEAVPLSDFTYQDGSGNPLPQTGDETPLGVWLVIIIACVAGACVLLLVKKPGRRD
ncbi:MAG: hypothetical protein LIO58_03005 [Oscillospiraceae bacterium]|nr:hypothetical protein [Oscillospiraceae bacterium]